VTNKSYREKGDTGIGLFGGRWDCHR